ncbi:HNH endonuclease [Gemmata sp.]|uniref:HNH endonuclease n=1 Tax=Gemmata sp. TaxID=1914242 RepID=UPI003F721305
MLVEMRPIDSIKPYPGNPRLNDPSVDAVAASISEFGFREEWRAIPGYEGLYEVSDHGRVRRSSKSRMAPAGYVQKLRLSWDGYPQVGLSKHQRFWHVKVHRLVALAFLGPPPFPKAHVAHFDGDKTNNRLPNLRWATAAENEADKRRHGRARVPAGERHPMARLTADAVRALRLAARDRPIALVAREFGVPHLTAYDAIVGHTWRTVTDPPPLPPRRRKAS